MGSTAQTPGPCTVAWEAVRGGLLAVLVTAFSLPSFAGTFVAYGPQTFLRTSGAPVPVTVRFLAQDPSASYTLRIDNATVTSATITLNGVLVSAPSEYSANVTLITKPVVLLATNELVVELRGNPGETFTIQIIGVDNTPPTITASAAPPPNAAGWNNLDVTVVFACADGTSGIAVCPAPINVATEGAKQVISGQAQDGAGNTATASVTISLDKTPPGAAITTPVSGARVMTPSLAIAGMASDALSGVAGVTCKGAPALLSGGNFTCNVSLTPGTNTIDVRVLDAAGNIGSTSTSLNVVFVPNHAPVVNAGPDQTITLPAAATLNGTVTDDGLPAGSTLTFTWSKVSGPGTVTFANPNAASTTASFSASGSYGLRLAATDSVLSSSDDVVVIVNPGVPAITSIVPASGQQGQSNLNVAITGQFTNFVNGQSVASFGAGITVNSTLVVDATHATANISLLANAALGPQTVTVTTGTEVASLSGGFYVVAAPNQAPIVSAGPNQTISLGSSPVRFTEYPVPTAGSFPRGITTGPDGNLWFTEDSGNQIGRITTAGVITEFIVPTVASAPEEITAGPDGNLWFTEYFANKIGRITPAGVITEFPLPNGGRYPFDITAGSDGNLWFAEVFGYAIGKITTAGVITEFPIPTANSGPTGITAGPDGNLWFTEHFANKIGRITPAGVITELPIPTANSVPYRITAGPDGNLWFTEVLGNKIGKITPAGVITEFPVPTAGSEPVWITTGPDGNLWFTENSGNQIGRITTAGVITEFPVSTPGSRPQEITMGPDGNLWFTEGSANKIVKAELGVFANPVTSALSGSVTDDGLPAGATLTATWSVTSGPGPVTFSNPTTTFPDVAGQTNPVATSATFGVPGTYTLGLTGSDSQLSSSSSVTITVNPPQVPTILSVNPNTGQQGQQNFSVTITGQSTHFVQGTTTAGFGAGIAVVSLTVNSATAATAVINIDPAAALGVRNVTLTSGAETATLTNGFSVTAGTPVILQVSPNQGQQGQTYVNLEFNTDGVLPSASHGFQYVTGGNPGEPGFGAPEAAVFSVSNGLLHMNTAALGANMGFAYYRKAGLFDPTQDLLIEMRVALYADSSRDFFTYALAQDLTYAGVIFEDGQMNVFRDPPPFALFPVADTGFHTYRINYRGATRRYELFVDGVQLGGAETYTYVGAPPSIEFLFGDPSGHPGFNGRADIDYIRFQNPPPVTITGQFTHFVQGTTTANFGANISVASLTVNSATTATAVLNIDPAATVGPRSVTLTTGTETATLGNGFTVTAGPPVLLTISPSSGLQGQQNLSVNITGQATHFAQGATQVSFGAGVTVTTVTVGNSTSLTAQISIDPNAVPGARTVTVTTGAEAAFFNTGFSVTGAGPAITTVSPNAGQQGQSNLNVAITGQFTNFVNGQSAASFGAGITVNGTTVADATHATANISILANAAPGPRTVAVTTGSEVAWLGNGFVLNAIDPGPTLITVSPSSGQQGQGGPVTIVGVNTHFVQGTSQLDMGPGIAVSGVTVTCATCLSAQVTIADTAATGPRSVTVTTGAEVATLANGFTVMPGTPFITSFGPTSGQQGQTFPVTVTGKFTHFAQGTTQVSLGAGVTVSNVNVSSPTSLTAQVAIDPNATPGARTLTVTTGAEVVSVPNVFTVQQAPAILLSLNPGGAQQGALSASVAITGQNTHFVQGTSQASFGAGVTVVSLAVSGPTSATAVVNIDPAAALGTRTVTITTGSEVASFPNGFTILAGVPAIILVNPNTGQQGQQNVSLAVTGQLTHFVQGTTQASFGAGITVVSLTVNSAATATAVVNIDPAASPGLRDATFTTGAEVAALLGGFAVNSGTAVLTQVGPNSGQQGQTNLPVAITGQFTNFVQGASQVSFGAGITVGTVTVTDATHLTAQISIGASASTGLHSVTVTTGSAVASLVNSFTVQPGTLPAITLVNPNSGQRGQSNLPVAITGQFTNFVQGTTQVSLGAEITVNSVTVADATHLSANISIAANALTGARTVTVTTGAEQVSLANAFTVQPPPNQAPIITIAPAWSVTLPSPLTLTYTVTDDALPAGGALTVSWAKVSGPGNVGFSNQTATSIAVGFDQAGAYVLRITATDTQLTAFKDVTVTATGNPVPPPTVVITSPIDGAEITTLTNVVGTANSTALASWSLEFKMMEEAFFRPFATGTTPVVNAVLGVFDPTLQLNGIAEIRLKATDTSGQTSTTAPLSLVLTKNQKVGNFTVSFNDLSVPVAGFPIQVVRTYDSRNKIIGDFGVGWTLDLRTVRLTENRIAGGNWNATTTGGAFPTYCVQPAKPHVATVTLPDGTNYVFDVVLTPQCQQLVPPDQVTIGFTPRPGTNASLAVLGSDLAYVAASFPGSADLFDLDTWQLFDANRYRLTLPDGRILDISQITGGLEKMTDLNGNTLTVTAGGIVHSSGKSVTFGRDQFGRITQITDPAGVPMTYAYDGNGDLVSFRDRENNTTTFAYLNHLLLDIRDPRGIQPIRNEYDASGRLIRHIDAFGNIINYTHNIGAKQEIVTDRLGNVTLNEYDADGNVVKVTDALGGVTLRTYDSRGNMLSERNALNKTRTSTYDGQDNRLTETNPLGNAITYTYNSRKQVLTITDPLGAVTTNTYDINTNLTSTKDPLGNATRYTYTAGGLQASMIDPLGNTTAYQYDGFGNLTKQTDPLGNATSFTYDGNGNKLSGTRTRTTSSGTETLTTGFQYDKLNRLTKTTYPDGSVTQVVYDSIGKQSATIDRLGRQTSFTYDSMGRLTQTTFPDGTTEKAVYDAEGRRTSATDRANRTTTYLYDKLGRLVTTTLPDGASTATAYDAIGQVTQVTDARGNVTRYAYDDAGRRTGVTDALNNVTSFTYDGAGNQTSLTDPKGNTTQHQYDASNRRTRTIHPDATFAVTAYDGLGRTISKTDQAGRTTQFQFDALGRLTQVTDALGEATRYAYDEVGNRIFQTDANNWITPFEYDKLGRRSKRTLPLGMSETYTYDLAGNLKTKTDFNGKTTTYAYDVLNRLLSKTPDPSLSQPTVSFTYTGTGRRATMVDASGTTTYTYDLRDRLINKATLQGTLTYTYDLHGNLTSIRSSNTNGTSVDYTYDALNRLSTTKDNRLSPGTTTHTYDAAGNLANYLYPNGVQHTYSYNTLNRLTNLTLAKGASTLSSFLYTLGPAGNRTSVAELGGRMVNYSYDPLYRLTNETIAGSNPPANNGIIGYTYDAVGNRLTRTSTQKAVAPASYSYDANDRLTSDSYDANGNTTASGGNTYTYDFENHLNAQNGTAVTIGYDGDGNRVAKTVGGTTTRYLVDDRNLTGYAQVLEEIVGGAVQRVYTYGLHRISQSQAGGTSFYGYDGHGSVRLLTDAAGAVTDRYDYDAFGNVISQAGTTPNPYLFAGEQFDSSLALMYLRARYLQLGSGRFWTADPLEAGAFEPAKHQHSYAYAAANPVNRVDPSGYLSTLDRALLGIEVHTKLGLDFFQNGLSLGHEVATNIVPVGIILAVKGLGCKPLAACILMPDLVDLETKEVYEIKTVNDYTAGFVQLIGYLSTLNLNDSSWPPWLPGQTYSPPRTITLSNGVIARVMPPDNGVIMYELQERTEKASVVRDWARGLKMDQLNQALFWATFGSALALQTLAPGFLR